ncbi:hypothetical protein [Oscillibacter sp.]|uniref:hypothetical protein n=1 Tax=Oscillibacter sp. TaxID=1945593 RepID=UPI0028B00B9A|nr:hypothetical protein [Oscillibacter sp.]
MRKSHLLSGLLFVLGGVACIIVALMLDTKLNNLLFGLSGALIVPGILESFKYFYWTAPKNKKKYAERLENESIELQDERKEKLRDKSGRYAYLLGLVIISISIIVFSILGQLEVIKNTHLIVIYLGGYFAFQYVAGILIFKHLDNKY